MPENPTPMTVEQARVEAQNIILPHVSFGRVSASAGGLIDEIAALLRRLPTPCARCGQAAALLDKVLADAESQHPGGWGPDVTTVGLIREAIAHLTGAPTR